MSDLPTVKELNEQAISLVEKEAANDIAIRQADALATLAEGVKSLSLFFTEGGLQACLASHTKGSIIQAIFGGLAAHSGRNALDARTIKQNSLEIVEVIEQVFNKMHERLQDRNRDPEIKEPQE